MPAIVPPGYTRGPILFMASLVEDEVERSLLQAFWQQAGGYGARILLADCSRRDNVSLRYADALRAWEADTVEVIAARTRAEANDAALSDLVDAATGVMLLGDNPLRLAATLGGTPLAQAVRRANARSKVVCAQGAGAPFLSQHMIGAAHNSTPAPYLHSDLVHFAPGLGLINRILVDVYPSGASGFGGEAGQIARLMSAVAHNPFLIGLGLDDDTAAVVQPDDTLTVLGAGHAVIVDGSAISYSSLHAPESQAAGPRPVSIFDVRVHLLAPGDTFALDSRSPGPHQDTDLPAPRPPATSAF